MYYETQTMSSDLSRFDLDCERGLLSSMLKALFPSPGRLPLGCKKRIIEPPS